MTKDKDMSEQSNKIHKVRPKAFIWPNKFVTADTSKKYPPHVMPLYLTDPNPLLARIAELEAKVANMTELLREALDDVFQGLQNDIAAIDAAKGE